jgi:hypothetical protein
MLKKAWIVLSAFAQQGVWAGRVLVTRPVFLPDDSINQ